MTTWIRCLLPGLLLSLLGCGQPAPGGVRVARQQTTAGARYSFFYADSLTVRVTTHRPGADDAQNLLSVAAAYTDLKTNQPLDLLVADGQVRQAQATVGFLEGVLTLAGDSVSIGRVPMGQAPPRTQLDQVARRGGTLLQELLVWEGHSVRGPGGARFQRRALAELAPGRFAVVESEADSLTMQQFAADLQELGVRRALYLDMGDWDEGWYRAAAGRVKQLGYRRTATARQSNWLVFGRPAAKR